MKLLILCLGNDLLGDDGIALEAADLVRDAVGPWVEVRSSSMAGLYLAELLEGFDDAIVVDAVQGENPGTVRELTPVDLTPVAVPSAHYAGLPEALEVARGAGLEVPHRIRIFGVEIGSMQRIGSPPSPRVRAALPELLRRVTEAAEDWGYG